MRLGVANNMRPLSWGGGGGGDKSKRSEETISYFGRSRFETFGRNNVSFSHK